MFVRRSSQLFFKNINLVRSVKIRHTADDQRSAWTSLKFYTTTNRNDSFNNSSKENLELFKPRISIVGVGGGGGNAINHMIEQQQLSEVEFYAFNTDRQDLVKSKSRNKVQLGPLLTRGEGAGANPEKGKLAAEESKELIREVLKDTDLLFLACGLGGGTGTGSSPIIAQTIKDAKKDIIIVAVVTVPFKFEGKRKSDIAQHGLEELSKHVDTLVCISNENLLLNSSKETHLLQAFLYADEILHTGIKSITNIIHKPGLINLDYSDLIRILSQRKGLSRIGFGEASGQDRAYKAVYDTLNNPLIEKDQNSSFKGLLINISGSDVTLKEIDRITTYLRENTDPNVQIFVGNCIDNTLNGSIRVFALFVQ